MASASTTSIRKPYPLYRRLIKIILWTVMAIFLLFYGTLTCMVSVLSPDKLTPLVKVGANRYLNADVNLGRVEFSVMSTYPFLRLELDSLTVVSRTMAAVERDSMMRLPLYADTLLTLRHFIGEVELPRLATGSICINDVEIDGPTINLVSINDSVCNFDILPPTVNDTDNNDSYIPRIELRRFAIVKPGRIRYYDMQSERDIDVRLEALLSKDGHYPRYRLSFGGNMVTPLLQLLRMTDADFSMDGDIEWDFDRPYALALHNFRLAAAFLSTQFDLVADFNETLKVEEFALETDTISVSRLMACLPDSIINEHRLNQLKTDALVSVKVHLDSLFDIGADSIPYATVDINVPTCKLRYGKARFDRLSADMSLILNGDNLDDAAAKVNDLELAGPATSLHVSGQVTNFISDPYFDIMIKGRSDLNRLPPPLMRHINGYISGTAILDLAIEGRKSMIDASNFHKLSVKGDMDGKKLYWVSADTVNMAYVHNTCLKFGTEEKLGKSNKKLLGAVIKVDSADILTGGLGINVTDFTLGFGADKSKFSSDTTIVVPMGGGLKVGRLNFNAISDSAGVRIRNIDGRVTMRRFKNMKRVPEFMFDLGIGRMAAGSLDGRMLFSNSQLKFTAHKLPSRRASQRLKRIADSIKVSRPDLPMDSVYRLAIERGIRNRKPYHRVHLVDTDSASEVIDWGTSKFIDKLLLDWAIDGSLSARRARLFTPHFPLRNLLNNLDITFNNDTILLNQLAYKVGRSDFSAVGRISNVRRALTSTRKKSPLKLDFETESDTVDINQIAGAFFKGAISSEHDRRLDLDIVDNDKEFEARIEDGEHAVGDTVAPVLIPVNIEADLRVKARNVLYSDLLMHNLTGDVMVYDGALNLHRLRAYSDIGAVDLSALYSAPVVDDIRFGFGLNVNRFDISRFLGLVPAVDSIMPLLRDISGIIDADIAATVKIDKEMNFDLPTLTAAIKLQGDSLQLLDRDTFKTIAKWLMFKDKQRNIIDHMTVEMIVSDNQMYLYPFVFDIDRYRIGVQGHNDLALNFNYLISVLKSPLPFKFGITIKGNPDDYKIRLGRAKFNEKQAVERKLVVDTTRINLIDQIQSVFRRGVRNSEFARLKLSDVNNAADINLESDPVTAADSLVFIKEGLIPAPQVETLKAVDKKKTKNKKK